MASRSTTQPSSMLFFLSFQIIFFMYSDAADTIPSGKSLRPGQTLISSGQNFELGFFTPDNSTNNYIGIWYKRVPLLENTKVWVANRDAPLRNSASAELTLLEDGNLVLYEDLISVWSTNSASNNTRNSTQAVLQHDGNLVLRNGVSPFQVLWQSFDYPTDTLGPGTRIGYDKRTNTSQVLTPWRNRNDPSKGVYTLEVDPTEDRLVIKINNTQIYWSSGRWNGQAFTSTITQINSFFNFKYVSNENESYLTYDVFGSSILYRFVMEPSGQFIQYSWRDDLLEWTSFWSQPRTQCDVYSRCGAFSVCNQSSTSLCRCIDGFVPRESNNGYMSDNYTIGCQRSMPLQCGDSDEFLLMSNSRLVGNLSYMDVANEAECKSACVNECSCNAYAYSRNCSIWNGELLNLQQISDDDDTDKINVYIRSAGSELHASGSSNKGLNTRIIVGVIAAVLVLGLSASYIWFKKRAKRTGQTIFNNADTTSGTENQKEDLELPLFDMVTVATASNQFSFSNKIGEGGFGPVYKGILPTGEEIAIKRLSVKSAQGPQEFMNEVLLIAKLQHRNLVRLLGCCIHGEERMLVYEYMPNGSLDSFIFDKLRSVDLNWTQRFNIIVGIARGLLYLHRDSRLRIIHRDLKAGNVLLDDTMNPKISDFGTARAFGGDQTEDQTKMVVGTYGYMSPEYATEGHFSMKSDVYSFGVLLLEIVSGKRNRGFQHASHDLNLLGHTWKLFNNNKTLGLMDESVKFSFSASEVLRCIQVGLLCVQKFPDDRPTMATVLWMLDTEGAVLPSPKEPGFYVERAPVSKGSSLNDDTHSTDNDMITLLEGR